MQDMQLENQRKQKELEDANANRDNVSGCLIVACTTSHLAHCLYAYICWLHGRFCDRALLMNGHECPVHPYMLLYM